MQLLHHQMVWMHGLIHREYEGEIYWSPGIHNEYEGVEEIYYDVIDYDLNCPDDNHEYHIWTEQGGLN